jgi:ketosteroid isomerase-like protein
MKIFILILMIVSLSLVASGQPKPGNSKTETELRNLVSMWDEAYVKGDTQVLSRLLADEFEFVGGPKKAEYLASFKTRPADSVQSAVSTDIQVQIYGDTAVLTGLDTISGQSKGQAYVVKFLYMDVWIKRGGRWQCVKTYASPANR